MNLQKPVEITSKGNNITGQYWVFTLYPNEDLDHKKIADVLMNGCYNSCRWIVHDKDKHHLTYDDDGNLKYYDGEPKKVHTHFLFKTEQTISIDKVSALVRLPTHCIERVNSIAVQVQYMTHSDIKSLFDDYQYKYPSYALCGALPINPNKWDESYLFQHWALYIKNTNQLWGDVVFVIGSAGHLKWLNKYRRILKDIYDSSHYREISVYENENQERSKK